MNVKASCDEVLRNVNLRIINELGFDRDNLTWLKSSTESPMRENPGHAADETSRLYGWSSLQDGLFILSESCVVSGDCYFL